MSDALLFILLQTTAGVAAFHWGRLNERGRWMRQVNRESKLMVQAFESVQQRHDQGEPIASEELEFLRGRAAANKAIWPGPGSPS